MKNRPEYVKRIKQLYARLKKDGGKASLELVDDPMQVLLLGVLCNHASEQRSAAALRKLLESVVDINELRVTPVADMIQSLGVDFPGGRRAATEITQVLNAIFNSLHHLDISFLKTQSKKAVNVFLDRLDGLTPHAAAFFRNRYLSHGDVPLDEHMLAILERSNCLPAGTPHDEAHRFVAGVFGERDGANFYAMFKRYAAAHAPRRVARKPEVAPKSAPPKAPQAGLSAGPAESTSKAAKKTGAGPTARPAADSLRPKASARETERKPAASRSSRSSGGKGRQKSAR
ncbi:MAG TPA: hypothetical protein VNT79_06125 [Phycisphaerae bacterium]|nr:hypothetical protein [Phycisphaerae bacterium]